MAPVRAGVLYFAIAFAAGFALGVLRTLAIAPALGELRAVALEMPVILAVAWLACRRLTARLGVPPAPAPRLAMGALAFVLLMLAEFALALLLGRGAGGFLGAFASPAGLLGLAAQIAFALFPLPQARRRESP